MTDTNIGKGRSRYGPGPRYGPPKKMPPFAPARIDPGYSPKKKYNRIKRCTAAYIFAPANEISGPSAFGALCDPPTSPSKGCGPRGQSHSVRSPPTDPPSGPRGVTGVTGVMLCRLCRLCWLCRLRRLRGVIGGGVVVQFIMINWTTTLD